MLAIGLSRANNTDAYKTVLMCKFERNKIMFSGDVAHYYISRFIRKHGRQIIIHAFDYRLCYIEDMHFKETRSVTMNSFRKKIFSF